MLKLMLSYFILLHFIDICSGTGGRSIDTYIRENIVLTPCVVYEESLFEALRLSGFNADGFIEFK